MENKIGSVPDFTPDEGVKEEKVETTPEVVEEKETPTETPADSVETDEKPVEKVEPINDDTDKVATQLKGLEQEREKLLKEIQYLRGERRELKKEELVVVDKKIAQTSDELKDVAPEDVSLIDRVLRAKGYMTKEESSKMHYDAVKNEKINEFLEEFPEYKPQNDPNDLNWNALQRQIQSWYRMPSDPKLVKDLLLKAHKDLAKPVSDRSVEVKKQQIKVASSGSTGAQRSSPKPTNERLGTLLRTHMQGWSDEEIKELEKKLPE